jgi:hypothetical protein
MAKAASLRIYILVDNIKDLLEVLVLDGDTDASLTNVTAAENLVTTISPILFQSKKKQFSFTRNHIPSISSFDYSFTY